VDRFDPSRNLKLKTLAEHRINGALLDYLRQVDPLPRAVRQFQKRRDAILQSFAAQTEIPTQDQLATMLGLQERKFVQLSRMVRASETIRFEDLSESARRKVA
jgi:RNA polymerase sigma factor for flagellar operon FliA